MSWPPLWSPGQGVAPRSAVVIAPCRFCVGGVLAGGVVPVRSLWSELQAISVRAAEKQTVNMKKLQLPQPGSSLRCVMEEKQTKERAGNVRFNIWGRLCRPSYEAGLRSNNMSCICRRLLAYLCRRIRWPSYAHIEQADAFVLNADPHHNRRSLTRILHRQHWSCRIMASSLRRNDP